MLVMSTWRRNFSASEAPTADAILEALQRAGASQGGAWVGAVPLVVREVSPSDIGQQDRYITSVAWAYEWPTIQPTSAAPRLLAAVARELGAGWIAPAETQPDERVVAFWRARTGWGGRDPNVFPRAQDDPMRGVASVLSDPTTQGVLAVGGVGLGLWLLSGWLGD